MKCSKPWSHGFLRDALPRAVCDRLRTARAELYIKRHEEPKLANDQLVIKALAEKKKLVDKKLKKGAVALRKRDTTRALRYALSDYIKTHNDDIDAIRLFERAHETYLDEAAYVITLEDDIRELKSELEDLVLRSGDFSAQSKPCPQQGCRGFLDSKHVCALCDAHVCEHCMVVISDGSHTCNPDDVETIKLLRKDTKPCPKCGEMIHKTDGCDQMYCTRCHTPFSWETGRVETGRIHNPHYLEMKRRDGLNVRPDIPLACGGLVEANAVADALDDDPYLTREDKSELSERLFRPYSMLRSLPDRIDRHYPVDVGMDHNRLRRLRSRYIQNKITKKLWVSAIASDMKRQEATREMRVIATTLVVHLADLFGNIVVKTPAEVAYEQMHQLRRVYNDACERVGKALNLGFPYISTDWGWFRFAHQSPEWERVRLEKLRAKREAEM